ncbi:MAG TPA: hypothetical protein VGJ95_01355, partial [Pseudonocardiaceae bacterium]
MTGAMFAGAGPEETERRIEQWAADVVTKADRYQTMQEQISRLSATERSADSAVQVTVDSSGALTDLVLSDHSSRLRLPQLAAQILDVVGPRPGSPPRYSRSCAAQSGTTRRLSGPWSPATNGVSPSH